MRWMDTTLFADNRVMNEPPWMKHSKQCCRVLLDLPVLRDLLDFRAAVNHNGGPPNVGRSECVAFSPKWYSVVHATWAKSDRVSTEEGVKMGARETHHYPAPLW